MYIEVGSTLRVQGNYDVMYILGAIFDLWTEVRKNPIWTLRESFVFFKFIKLICIYTAETPSRNKRA